LKIFLEFFSLVSFQSIFWCRKEIYSHMNNLRGQWMFFSSSQPRLPFDRLFFSKIMQISLSLSHSRLGCQVFFFFAGVLVRGRKWYRSPAHVTINRKRHLIWIDVQHGPISLIMCRFSRVPRIRQWQKVILMWSQCVVLFLEGENYGLENMVFFVLKYKRSFCLN
jgi:hypothetical protein